MFYRGTTMMEGKVLEEFEELKHFVGSNNTEEKVVLADFCKIQKLFNSVFHSTLQLSSNKVSEESNSHRNGSRLVGTL